MTDRAYMHSLLHFGSGLDGRISISAAGSCPRVYGHVVESVIGMPGS